MPFIKSISMLDKMRMRLDTDSYKSWFLNQAAKDRAMVLQYVNDPRLRFPSLFSLIPEIASLDLCEKLNARNASAMRACAMKLDNRELAEKVGQFTSGDISSADHDSLKWMFMTGCRWDAPHADRNAYDAIMDAAAAVLIGTYEEISILPTAVETIFRRNRNGLYIHDLVWSIFQTFDPNALRLTASYLLSTNRKDRELACTLLHLQQPANPENNRDMRRLHDNYLLWLKSNSPFIYLTGESFQMTSEPEHLRVDEEAKYLRKKISAKERETLEPLIEDEKKWLMRFRKTTEDERRTLSSYSHYLYNRDSRSWKQWMEKPEAEHIEAAKAGLEAIK